MAKLSTSQQLRPHGGGLFGIFTGVSYPLRAFRMLQMHKGLRSFIVIPLIINSIIGVFLYSVGVWWGLKLIDSWIQKLTDWIGPAWLDTLVNTLSPVIQGGLILLLMVILGLLLLQFGSILGSPFYGQLSEKLESLRTGASAAPDSLGAGAIVRDIWRAVMFELKKLMLLLGGGGLLLLASTLPGIGAIVTTIGSVTLAIILLCLDMFDATLERRRLKFRQKLSMVVRCFPASASFGLICLGLVSIPLMNLLAIPLCVASGTLFVCDRMLTPATNQPS